jgi:hypothetical protein
MTLGTVIYFAALVLWSASVAYYLLFRFGRKSKPHEAPAAHAAPAARQHAHSAPSARGRFSAHEGFKSFQKGHELTVEDILRGLSEEL